MCALLEHLFLVHLCLHIGASDRDRLKQLEQEKQIKNKNQGQYNGSTGKGICCQAGQPEFDPWNLYGGRKESTLKCCCLTSPCALACTYPPFPKMIHYKLRSRVINGRRQNMVVHSWLCMSFCHCSCYLWSVCSLL